MRSMKDIVFLSLATAILAAAPAAAHGRRDLGRETLPANDGWASFSTGTTGGSLADDAHVFVVTSRAELLAALDNRSAVPKIIQVTGTIDANVDDLNAPLACADYERNGYTIEAYLEAYDPVTWGRVIPSGPLEDARRASQLAQQDRVRIRIGSNTTIVGTGRRPTVRGAWFDIRDADNIIIRNLTFEDTVDCFPQWNPTDGSLGNWNSQYDSLSLRTTTHVWVDHNTFRDRTSADETLPLYFGRLFQVHDGHFDITNASDLVTVSWNRLLDHDKVMLIGSSDTATADRGKLRVTLHHNVFDGVGQRGPRVRFGQVHVYNNYYRIVDLPNYQYSLGVGIESQTFAENNFWRTDDTVTPDQFLSRLNGTAIHIEGTLVNGILRRNRVDVVAEYNAVNDPDLLTDVGWTPTLFVRVDPAWLVPFTVPILAGAFPSGLFGH
jgi:pectate lyase